MKKDERSFHTIVVAHCILNQNARVFGLAKYKGIINEVINVLKEKNYGIIQMPCPEFSFLGLSRPSQTKEQYDTPEYRKHCRKIAEDIASQIKEYLKNEFKISILLGIRGSPSCGESGIFIEELERELKNAKICIPFLEIDTENIKEAVTQLKRTL